MGYDPPPGTHTRRLKNEFHRHEVLVRRHFAGRLLVTVAQFRVFVDESGFRPGSEEYLRGLASHPVTSISWYEAMAYCR
jgi:formylglycine-generating enzyme required for sulfatase activity